MNKEEFESLKSPENETLDISISDLDNKTPRTLIYGYTCDRDYFHLFLNKKGQFCLHIYKSQETLNYETLTEIEPSFFTPDKRAYPEACDYEFYLLMLKHEDIPFTVFNENREEEDFYGLISYLNEDYKWTFSLLEVENEFVGNVKEFYTYLTQEVIKARSKFEPVSMQFKDVTEAGIYVLDFLSECWDKGSLEHKNYFIRNEEINI